MPFTTNWIWGPISRSLDINVVDETNTYTRNNWVLQRFRFTDEEFLSELGEESEILSAFSGAEEFTEKINPASNAYVTFSANTAWTLAATKWYETGFIKFGMPTYKPQTGTTNIPDNTKTNIIRVVANKVGDVYFYGWACAEYTNAEVASGAFTSKSPSVNWIRTGYLYSEPTPITNGLSFENNFGTFTGDATASIIGATTAIPFRCVQDDKEYEPLTKWFKQTQTWAYKDEWKLDV